MLKLERQRRRSCLNCSHLRRHPDGFVPCDMDWFWNKFNPARRNLMRHITVEKKGARYAAQCPDFDNKHLRQRPIAYHNDNAISPKSVVKHR